MSLSLTIDSISMGQGTVMPSAASIPSAPEQWFVNFATGNPTGEAGPAVNEFTAMNYLAVYQCVSLIAGKIAEVPLETYVLQGEDVVPAKNRSERPLLLWEFNRSMSAMTARETGLAHLLTWGNSFTQIVKNKSGSTVVALVPMGPDVTKVRRASDGSLIYDVFRRGTSEQLAELKAEEVLHVPGLGFDGLMGYSPIRVAKTSIRSGMAQDREAEKFVTRGIRSPGAVKFPAGRKFKDKQEAIQFRDDFRAIHNSDDGALSVVILEDGAEWQAIGVDPKSAQLLDSRKYSRKEICGIYRVPPFLIGDIESSTSWGTGVGQQVQNFVDYCLLTWMRRIEVEYKRKLGRDDPNVYYRHCVEDMLRGDFEARTKSLNTLHGRGIITDNEWRKIEHMNPVVGGNVRHVPLNEVLIDEDGDFVAMGNTATAVIPSEDPPATETAAIASGDAPKSDVPADTAAEAAGSGNIQSTALNGAQITSLLLLTDKVAMGDYTAGAGEAIMQASFPLMDRKLISTMITELSQNPIEPPKPAAPPTAEPPDPEPPSADPPQARFAGLLRKVIVSAAARCLRREAAEARKAATRIENNFIAWVDDFYAKQTPIVVESVGPAVEAWAAAFGGPADYPEQHVARSRRELLDAADGPAEAFAERIDRLVSRWETDRLIDVANEFNERPKAVIDTEAFLRP